MDQAQRKRAQFLRRQLWMRQMVDKYSPHLDALGLSYVVLTEEERAELRTLSEQWNRTNSIPGIGVGIDLPSMDEVVDWLNNEFPLAEIGDPNIAPEDVSFPFFRVHLDSWDQIVELVPDWFTVQVCASGTGKNAAFGGGADRYDYVALNWRMTDAWYWPDLDDAIEAAPE